MSQFKNRREFLINSIQTLAGFGLSSQMISTLISGSFNKAFANNLSPNSLKYIYMNLPNAPARWMFDLLLTPNGSNDKFIPGGFGNAIEIDSVNKTANPVYHNVPYQVSQNKTIYLPPIWNMGDSIDFTSILPHTTFIRGVDMEINNHVVSNARQLAPIIGGKSIAGVIADKKQSPISAIDFGLGSSSTAVAFKSKSGLGSIFSSANLVNPISEVIKPFLTLSDTISFRTPAAQTSVNKFLDQIDTYTNSLKISKNAMRNTYESAENLISLNINSLANLWDPTYQRYLTLISKNIEPEKGDKKLAGVFDNAVPYNSSEDKKYFIAKNVLSTHSDLRDLFPIQPKGSTLTRSTYFAKAFALTEILMISGLTSVIDLSLTTGALCSVVLKYPINGSDYSISNIPVDQHDTGALVNIISNTIYFRGLLAGITELVNKLKLEKIFNNTIIHISSEFNRSPRTDFSGSDHGVNGSNVTLISGMFNELQHIGNLNINSNAGIYTGTWGVASNWIFEDGVKRPIRVNDIAKSISAMTKSEDVVANGYSLFQSAENGIWTPIKSGGQNVA